MSRCVLILLAFALAGRAFAMPPPDGLVSGGTARVAAALDGMTLRLDDGRIVRLAAVEAPRPEAQPPAARGAVAAARAVADMAEGREIALYYDERSNDRYGRIIAHVVVLPDRWLQEELVRRGLARVTTTADTAAAAGLLLPIEAEARTARRGLWSQTAFQPRRPDELGRWVDSFQIVEGRVAELRRAGNDMRLRLSGPRGRNAEIVILSAARRRFRAVGIDPAELDGRPVRVRGWVRWQDGPVIDVDHPAQIELLDPG